MVSLSKVRARCETVRKEGEKSHAVFLFALLLLCVCGLVPTEMMDDGMCTHNLLTLQPVTLTINCLFPSLCSYICVCVWCS